ncbi:MAG: sensor histidine kinase [Lachnospiraceae bacterium]
MIRWFNRQKLNVKFTIIIGMVIFIPLIIIYLQIFQNFKVEKVNDVMKNMEVSLAQNQSNLEKTAELCTMSSQAFLNNDELKEYVTNICDGKEYTTLELINFNKDCVKDMERIVNSNPYLYQVRVFVNSDTMHEMMPILYRRERISKIPWIYSYESGSWEFDYSNPIFPVTTMNVANHIMSLISTVEDHEHGEMAIVEVTVRMEQVFPQMFQNTDAAWTAFVDSTGEVYAHAKDSSKWDAYSKEILQSVRKNGKEKSVITTQFNGESVVLGYIPVNSLHGGIVQLVSMEHDFEMLNRQRIGYLFVLLFIFIALMMLIDRIVLMVLKQFYQIHVTVSEVHSGNLDARVKVFSEDEMGALGNQVNQMLTEIQNLMQQSLDQQLLVKNSEIRALQNQINAHFIYNVLESIKMMAEVKEDYEISNAITSLGKLLRYSMRWVSQNVTVAEEIDYIMNYLKLINLRFDYEIYLSMNLPDEMMKQEIPKMSLQPIIENAICHGLEDIAEDTSIYMKGTIEEGICQIEISDAGVGMTQEQVDALHKKIAGEIDVGGGSGNGIGLKNVQDRLQISFGPEYGISIHAKLGCYTKVIVRFPKTK